MANDIDVIVGKKIRQGRWMKMMTQSQLGKLIGCRFQQVQKYETGANRVSASRLVLICRALDVRPSYLFEGMGFDDEPIIDLHPELTRKEAEMICVYRNLTPEFQEKITALIRPTD